jgi:hypothetical protein
MECAVLIPPAAPGMRGSAKKADGDLLVAVGLVDSWVPGRLPASTLAG